MTRPAEGTPRPAEVQYEAVGVPLGTRPPDPRSRRLVRLALIGEEDHRILARHGLTGVRRHRLVRLCTGAMEQGALLGYGDLAHLLSTSPSTLKRDVRAVERAGVRLPLLRWKRAPRGESRDLLIPAAVAQLALGGMAAHELCARLLLTEAQVLDWAEACRAVQRLAAERHPPEAIARVTGHGLPLVYDYLLAAGVPT